MSFLWWPSRRVIVGSLLLLTAIAAHVEAGAAQLQLTWTNNSTNEDGFKIERSTGTTATFVQIGVTGPGVTSYTDSGLADAITYCYRVRAYNAAGDSDSTNVGCGTTPQTFALAIVRAGTGDGTVTGSPGITCGTSCSASYASGTAVTLTATPAAGFAFTGWSGGGCSGTGSCTVTLTATTTVISTFGPPPPATISSLTADKNAPQPPGTTITFSATATGGTTPYQYKWYVGDGTGWSVAQNWSTSSTYAWTPTTANVNYRLEVWVRSAGNTVDLPEGFPANVGAYRDIFFAISPATVTGLTADRSAPQPPGTTVTFSATATGGIAPYQYKWYVGDGTGWSVAQNWSTSSTYAWTPTTANVNYRLEVWVRSAGNTVDLPEGFPATGAYRDIFFAIN